MSKSSYDNIDNCINILFNAIYGKSDKCYAITPIKRKAITIDDLRKPLNFDSSAVFEGEFKLINSDKFRINYKRTNSDNIACTVSIGVNKLNQNDISRPELQHMAMLYMCSEIVFNEKFHGILLPLMCFDIEKDNLFKMFPRLEKDLPGLENIGENIGDKMYVIITEHYFKTQTLQTYLDENIKDLNETDIKGIFFQIFYIITKICERFNNFTHGSLNFDSILVWKKAQQEKKELKIGTTIFEIVSDIELKLTNFDKSSTSDYYNTIQKYNPYYDIYHIASYLFNYLNLHNKTTPNIKQFFDEILPEKFRFNKDIKHFAGLNEDKFDMNSEEIITTSILLKKNKFFKQFIKMDLSVSPKEFQNESIKDFAQKGEGISYIENYKNKLNKKNKKSSVNYSMYKGSRRIVVPGFSNTGLTSEYSEKSNVFTGGSESEKPKKSVKKDMKYKSKTKQMGREEINPSVTSVTETTETETTAKASETTETDKKNDKKSSSSSTVSSLNTSEKVKDSLREVSRNNNKKTKEDSSISSSALSISEGGARKRNSKNKCR